ncbi:glycosyltransferase [Rhodobacteraceae bacterium NNCM2]|nr:glycosyltransferase [Coraliihabitans acroporae]
MLETVSNPERFEAKPPLATLIVRRRLDSAASGSGVYLLEFLRCLREAGYRIRVLCAPSSSFGNRPVLKMDPRYLAAVDEVVWPQSMRIGDQFISTSLPTWRRGIARLIRGVLAKWVKDLPVAQNTLGLVPEKAELDAIVAATDPAEAECVIAEYSSMGPILERFSAPCKAVLLHDMFSMRAAAFLDAGEEPDHNTITLDGELAQLRDANLFVHASCMELETVKAKRPDATHVWLKPGVEILEPSQPSDKAKAVFVGAIHAGNVDALNGILKIWPEVVAEVPEAELVIAGEICNLVPEGMTGVTCLGRVENIGELGGENAIGLAPMSLASGVCIKVASYLGMGMSVVVLPTAMTGYGDALDDIVCERPDYQGFKDELVSLFSDPERRRAIARKGGAEIAKRLDNADIISVLRSVHSAPAE